MVVDVMGEVDVVDVDVVEVDVVAGKDVVVDVDVDVVVAAVVVVVTPTVDLSAVFSIAATAPAVLVTDAPPNVTALNPAITTVAEPSAKAKV